MPQENVSWRRAVRLTGSENGLLWMSWTKKYLTSAKKKKIKIKKIKAYSNAKQFLSKSKMREWREELPFLTFTHVGGKGVLVWRLKDDVRCQLSPSIPQDPGIQLKS